MTDPSVLARRIRVRLNSTVDPATRDITRAWMRAYVILRDDLVRTAAEAAERGPLSRADFRAGRLGASMDLTARILADLNREAGVTIIAAIPQVTAASAEVMESYIIDRGRGLGIDLNHLPAGTLDHIVRRTTGRIHAATIPLTASAQTALHTTLVQGVMRGEGPREVARLMVKETRGVFGGGMTRALNLARTELVDAHRAGAAEVRRANGRYVTGWRWSAKLDTRTCPACWAMHNSEHRDDEVMEGHQQCRCVPVPMLVWDGPEDGLGDPATAFRNLPRDDQRKIMGPARLDALDRGVPFSALAQRRANDGWRHGHYATPVRELRPV